MKVFGGPAGTTFISPAFQGRGGRAGDRRLLGHQPDLHRLHEPERERPGRLQQVRPGTKRAGLPRRTGGALPRAPFPCEFSFQRAPRASFPARREPFPLPTPLHRPAGEPFPPGNARRRPPHPPFPLRPPLGKAPREGFPWGENPQVRGNTARIADLIMRIHGEDSFPLGNVSRRMVNGAFPLYRARFITGNGMGGACQTVPESLPYMHKAGMFFDNRRNFTRRNGGGAVPPGSFCRQAFRRSGKCLRSLATLGAEVNRM